MQVIINNKNVMLDNVQVTTSINDITRQFTIKDISNIQNYKKQQQVEIYDDNDILLIKAEVEYIEAVGNETTSEFIYAGRNDARFIVDCYADKTIQFTEKQKLNTVLSEVASKFGLKITGDAELPADEIKTILIGDKFGEAFLEITQSAGQIITSDAEGNLLIDFEATDESDTILEYGINIRKRNFKNDTTEMYDKYVVVSQSNYLIQQEQQVDVQGSYGDGKFIKVLVSKHTLTAKECEQIAEIEYKKDARKSFDYSIVVDEDDLKLNTKYFIRDTAVGIDEMMNLKTIEIDKSSTKDEMRCYFERIL